MPVGRHSCHVQGAGWTVLGAGTTGRALLGDYARGQIKPGPGNGGCGLGINRQQLDGPAWTDSPAGYTLELAETPGIIHVGFKDGWELPGGQTLSEHPRRAGPGTEAAGQAQPAEPLYGKRARWAGPGPSLAVQSYQCSRRGATGKPRRRDSQGSCRDTGTTGKQEIPAGKHWTGRAFISWFFPGLLIRGSSLLIRGISLLIRGSSLLIRGISLGAEVSGTGFLL
jgi:hypothetical protein